MFPARIELAHLVPETSALSTELRELLCNHIISGDACEVYSDHEGRHSRKRAFQQWPGPAHKKKKVVVVRAQPAPPLLSSKR